MRLDEACERVFARHETFHPRYGWLLKAVEAANRPDDLFNDEKAVVELGVGKNMVKSIRHWGSAFKLIEPDPSSSSRRPSWQPSRLGEAMFGPLGADRYMELPGTLWFLHWLLLAPKSQAPVWWSAFNEFPAVEFTEEQLHSFVFDRMSDFGAPNANSVKKDVALVLRMYSSGHAARATFDDRVDAPFRELGLLQPSSADDHDFRFNLGPKPGLPPLVFAAAVLDFAGRLDPDSRVVSISKALAEPGSPGRAFKLTDGAAGDLLEVGARESKILEMGVAAGMPQLLVESPPRLASVALLREHYKSLGTDLHYTEDTQDRVA